MTGILGRSDPRAKLRVTRDGELLDEVKEILEMVEAGTTEHTECRGRVNLFIGSAGSQDRPGLFETNFPQAAAKG